MKHNRKQNTPPNDRRSGPASAQHGRASAPRWVFRLLAATLIPLILLGLFEAGLRLVGYGHPSGYFLTVKSGGQTRVISNDSFSRRFFPAGLDRRPLPVSFSPTKPAGTYRIFVMGESAAMGDPEPAFAFSRILEVLLRERFPGTKFEVINVAFTAINSHVILPIARDCARQHGDLWIVYMGHNEVHGPFGVGTAFDASRSRLWVIRSALALRATRIGQLIDSARARWSGSSPRTWRGLEMFLQNQVRREDPRLETTYRQFERNLQDMLKAAQSSQTQVILCSPASNLKDSAPFASVHGTSFLMPQRAEWDRIYGQAVAAQKASNYTQALPLFLTALRLDSLFADLQFRVGQCSLAMQQPEVARTAFENARDFDALRLRTDGRLLQIIHDTAGAWKDRGVHLCETRRAAAGASATGVPGDDLFFDHVHLNFQGNYALALALAEQASGLLPASMKGRDAGQWSTAEACAQRLGLTDWSLYRMYEGMQRRLMEAPFTNQLNHIARQRAYLQKLNELRPALEPDGIAAAADACRDALQYAPDDANLHELYGRVLLAANDNTAALAEFMRLTELWPQHPVAFNNVGVLLQREGKHADAEKYFHAALIRRPEFAEARYRLGVSKAAQGDLSAAVACYQQALAQNPELVEAKISLAKAWQQQGKLDEAEQGLRSAAETHPAYAPARLALADFLIQRGRVFDALPQLSDAARAQPQLVLAQCRAAAEAQPQDAVAHLKLANVLATLNKSSEAVQSLRTAVRLNTNFWEARYLLGVELAAQEAVPEAAAQFAAAIQIHPGFARAHVNLGVALAKQMKLMEAAAQFQQALQLEPTNQAARQYLQTVQALQGRGAQPPQGAPRQPN